MKGPAAIYFFHSYLTMFSQIALLLLRPMPRISYCRRDLQSIEMTLYRHTINAFIMANAYMWSYIATALSPLET